MNYLSPRNQFAGYPIGQEVKAGESCQPCQVINYDHIWPALSRILEKEVRLSERRS